MTDKQVALITGGAKGIGLATAKYLFDKGFQVIINAHSKPSDEQISIWYDEGYSFDILVGDVADDQSAETMVDNVFGNYGTIDALVNNAGMTKDKLLTRMSTADFKSVIDTNLVGTFNMTKHALKIMQKKRQGAIVNLASISGLRGNIGQANYSASKAGIIGLTKTAAREGALRNVRVNAVAPGMVQTAMVDKMGDKRQAEVMETIPLKRFAKPEEIAQTIAFLIENQYITGQVITVDGGLTI